MVGEGGGVACPSQGCTGTLGQHSIKLAISFKLQGTQTRKTGHDMRVGALVVLFPATRYWLSVPLLVSS